MAGLSGNINLIASGVQYALFIIFTTVMFFYIDKMGRRPLLIGGAFAMGAAHFIVGGLLSAGKVVPGGVGGNPNIPIELTGAKANAVIAFCYILIVIYAMTLAPVAWIYAAEVWSSRLVPLVWVFRLSGTGIEDVLGSSRTDANRYEGFSTLPLGSISHLAPSTSITACSSSSAACACSPLSNSTSLVRMCFSHPPESCANVYSDPETAGKTLEEIEEMVHTRQLAL